MDDDQWTRECNSYLVRKQLLRICTMGCFSVAYCDMVIGVTVFAHVSMRIINTGLWYPYVLPAPFHNVYNAVGPLDEQFYNLSVELAFFFLSLCAVLLFVGTWKKMIWLINCWFVPNILFLIALPPTTIALSILNKPTYSFVIVVAAHRVFAVIAVFLFKSTLTFRLEEDARLRQRCVRATGTVAETGI